MQDNVQGPAAGTRSRTKSGFGGNTEESAEKAKTDYKAQEIKIHQKLVSDFFVNVEKDYCSDSEVEKRSKLRSKSGKIYQSTLNFPLKAKSKSVSRNAITRNNDMQAMNSQEVNKGSQEVNRDSVHEDKQTVNSGNPSAIYSGSVIATTTTVNTCVSTMSTATIMTTNTTPLHQRESLTQQRILKENQLLQSTEILETQRKQLYYTQPQQNPNAAPPISVEGNTTMDGAQLVSLLQNINIKLDTIQDDVRALKTSKGEITEEMQEIRDDREEDRIELLQQKKDLDVCKDKMEVFTELMARYEDRIQYLNNRCNYIEAKAMKSEMIFFGLLDNKQPCAKIAETFLKDVLGLTEVPDILYAYWKGKGPNKPMVVRFVKQSAKGLIYSNVSKLKDRKNANDRPYRLDDHLPEEMAEIQHRYGQIISSNKKLLDGDRREIKRKNGQLLVENQIYKKKVQAPTAKTLLNMDMDDLQKVKQMEVAHSEDKKEGGSKFKVFATKVTNLVEVRDFMEHMRRRFIEATHVVVSYRLAGLCKAYDEDFVDDQEHGMGRRMLDLLVKRNCINTAVAMVRHYGGQHIGGKRFEIVRDLQIQALDNLEAEMMLKSVLPLRCLINNTAGKRKKKERKTTSPGRIRGGHANHPRFNAELYNKFTPLPFTTEGDSSQTDFETASWNEPNNSETEMQSKESWAEQTEQTAMKITRDNPGDEQREDVVDA